MLPSLSGCVLSGTKNHHRHGQSLCPPPVGNCCHEGGQTLRTQCNKTWNLAPKAPISRAKSKTVAGKKKVVRTKRLIGVRVQDLRVGRGGWVNAVMQREASAFRTGIQFESKRVPWLPSISKGAIALIEQFLCAYAQEATRHAVSVRVGLGRTNRANGEWIPMCTRLNAKLMKLGYDAADAGIFGSAMPVPRATLVCKPDKKTPAKDKGGKSKDAEDGDYEAPEAE